MAFSVTLYKAQVREKSFPVLTELILRKERDNILKTFNSSKYKKYPFEIEKDSFEQ